MLILNDHFIVTRRHQCSANTTFDRLSGSRWRNRSLTHPFIAIPSISPFLSLSLSLFLSLARSDLHASPVCFTRHSEVCNSRFAFILAFDEPWVLNYCPYHPVNLSVTGRTCFSAIPLPSETFNSPGVSV